MLQLLLLMKLFKEKIAFPKVKPLIGESDTMTHLQDPLSLYRPPSFDEEEENSQRKKIVNLLIPVMIKEKCLSQPNLIAKMIYLLNNSLFQDMIYQIVRENNYEWIERQ